MFIFDYILIFLALGTIIWSLFLYYKKYRMVEAKYLSFFIFNVGFWILSLYFALFSKDSSTIVLWTRMCYFFGSLSIIFFRFFIFVFYNKNENIFKNNKFIIIFLFIFCILNFILPDKYIYFDIEIYDNKAPRGTYGIFYNIFSIFIFYIIIISIRNILLKYKNLNSLKKQQIRYVILGGVIAMFGGILFVVFLPLLGVEEFYSIGPMFFIFFIWFTSYAIIRHQLLDIRIVIQRGIIYSVSIAFVVAFYLLLIFLFGFIFTDQYILDVSSAIMTIIIGIYGVPIIEKYFKRWTDRIFFKDKYDYSTVLYEFSEILNNNINLEVLLEKTFIKLRQVLKVQKIRIVLLEQELVFDEHAQLRPIKEKFSIEAKDIIVNNDNAVITGSDIQYLMSKLDKNNEKDNEYRKILQLAQSYEEKYHFEVFVAMISRKKLIGLILLGPKMSGDVYSGEDVSLLKTFAHQAAVAMEKSQLYEKAKDYSRELEKKVKKRTSRIKGLQEEQQQMMLEIAHGLQTPLTIIKGQLNILKDEIKDTEKLESFEKSIDRISRFIYAMLRSAKLDSRDQSQHIMLDLSALLEEFLESVHIITQEKNIEILHNIKEGIFIMGNKSEIEELLMNMISNSVKYMDERRKKKITIDLNRHKNRFNKAILTIEDTGIGIGKEHLPNLFSKFYRIKDDMQTKGTGLGLVICKKIIEKHNGRIRVESQVGKGTKFIIDFPLVK